MTTKLESMTTLAVNIIKERLELNAYDSTVEVEYKATDDQGYNAKPGTPPNVATIFGTFDGHRTVWGHAYAESMDIYIDKPTS